MQSPSLDALSQGLEFATHHRCSLKYTRRTELTGQRPISRTREYWRGHRAAAWGQLEARSEARAEKPTAESEGHWRWREAPATRYGISSLGVVCEGV